MFRKIVISNLLVMSVFSLSYGAKASYKEEFINEGFIYETGTNNTRYTATNIKKILTENTNSLIKGYSENWKKCITSVENKEFEYNPFIFIPSIHNIEEMKDQFSKNGLDIKNIFKVGLKDFYDKTYRSNRIR